MINPAIMATIAVLLLHLPINFVRFGRINVEYLKLQWKGAFAAFVVGAACSTLALFPIALIGATLVWLGVMEPLRAPGSSILPVWLGISIPIHLICQLCIYKFINEDKPAKSQK
jgi:sorbitol-specific phosphotransferase system component IIC